MLSKKKRDLIFRKNYKKKEILSTTLKFLSTNYLNQNKNSSVFNVFNQIKQKNFSRTKVVRRCILTNRSRGSIQPFNISRIKLREFFQVGIFPGYKKGVW